MWSVQTGKSILPVFILFFFMPNLIAPWSPSQCAGENPTSLCSLTTLCLGFFFRVCPVVPLIYVSCFWGCASTLRISVCRFEQSRYPIDFEIRPSAEILRISQDFSGFLFPSYTHIAYWAPPPPFLAVGGRGRTNERFQPRHIFLVSL